MPCGSTPAFPRVSEQQQLDEMFVSTGGERMDPWRGIDHRGSDPPVAGHGDVGASVAVGVSNPCNGRAEARCTDLVFGGRAIARHGRGSALLSRD
jgi:hypothetical protein